MGSVRRLLLSSTVVAACGFALAACGGGSTTPPSVVTPPPSPTLAAVTLASSTITAGQSAQGTVTLSSNAASPVTVSLSIDAGGISITNPVTVAAGSSTATFTVTTNAGSSPGSFTITATANGVIVTTTLVVTAAPVVKADFNVMPDAGTGANPGQCIVSQISGQLLDIMKCTFDASISTPNPGITSFTWTFPNGAGTTTFTGMTLQDESVTCGSFGSATVGITLTVVAPAGSASNTKQVTFIKANAC
jgi:trimeric autotransporter adhesin